LPAIETTLEMEEKYRFHAADEVIDVWIEVVVF